MKLHTVLPYLSLLIYYYYFLKPKPSMGDDELFSSIKLNILLDCIFPP